VHHRGLACRAYATAGGGRPGPVHVNFPLREPLAPVHEELDAAAWGGRPDGRPWVDAIDDGPEPEAATIAALRERVAATERGAIVCGTTRGDPQVEPLDLARATGWPLLADPASGYRFGWDRHPNVVSHYDLLLRAPRFADAQRPQLVIRVGDTPTSKPLRAWLADVDQVVVDPDLAWHEPTRQAGTLVRGDAELLGRLAEPGRPRAEGWLEAWRHADDLVPDALAATPDPFEPKVWNAVAEAAPEDATLWVASSMPIRDVEALMPATEKRLRLYSNRGANGIDGTVSSALGAALAGGRRVVLLVGDVALLHDLGGLVAARRLGAELTIVCANNGGGNIFDHLPVAASAGRDGLHARRVARRGPGGGG
jgi:2-succinyl-5-enolpyruvyl-6-hydroxy-3-cyclohexene-1-carboxylate synthase